MFGAPRTGRHRAPRSAGTPRRTTLLLTAATTVGASFAGTAGAAPQPAPAPASAPAPSADPELSAVARDTHAEPLVPGTPCSVSARACVDLETQQAWLIRDGTVARGPMTIASGGAGHETPVGHSYRVYRKDADHESREFRTPDGRPSPMPWSTFFADGGVAFHAGDPARSSAGCIRMTDADARAVFDDLRAGDKVQVVDGSRERAARR